MYKVDINTLKAIKNQLLESNRLLEQVPQKLFDIEFMILENNRLLELIKNKYDI